MTHLQVLVQFYCLLQLLVHFLRRYFTILSAHILKLVTRVPIFKVCSLDYYIILHN
jgi:hypothetical protein